ncbi:hypothetical protein DB29_03755 [Shouchella clausii]|nr:hypothetical protein DB29_03755 [Shouchella clausii]
MKAKQKHELKLAVFGWKGGKVASVLACFCIISYCYTPQWQTH